MNRPRVRADAALVTEATVSSLAPGGDGVAHVEWRGDRRAVLVAGAAPGDLVSLEVDLARRPARGRILDLVAGGRDRVVPPCTWSADCGGCDWMHLSGEAQMRVHVEHVRAALPPRWRHVPIAASPSPHGLGYRCRAQVHVRAAPGGRVIVGMHAAGTHRPVQVDRCVILEPALERGRAMLSDLFGGCTGRGDVRLATGTDGLPVLDAQWRGVVAPETFARLERAVIERSIAGAQVTMEGATRPARIGDPTPWMEAPDGLPLRLPTSGFGQANASVNTALATHVAGHVRAMRPSKAIELYSGAGNLSVILAREVGELTCVETSREACGAARANLAARSLAARVVEADADQCAIPRGTGLVVLDPPRTGARAVVERLAASRTPHVIYVSCDAQTLGRDLRFLQEVYTPRSVATFEMFPQTSHVEIVVVMRRERT